VNLDKVVTGQGVSQHLASLVSGRYPIQKYIMCGTYKSFLLAQANETGIDVLDT
jgi:hypothetical protein